MDLLYVKSILPGHFLSRNKIRWKEIEQDSREGFIFKIWLMQFSNLAFSVGGVFMS